MMRTVTSQKLAKAFPVALAAILLFFASGVKLPVLDSTADHYFQEAILKASATYATCRVINASVSIVKDSSLNLEPAGVGVTLALGQFLDPIDDMTERASDILVTAITSLGVQKLAYEIGVFVAPSILAVLLLFFAVLFGFGSEKWSRLQQTVLRLIFLIVIARLALPIAALANNYLQQHFFEERIASVNNELQVDGAEIDKLKDFSAQDTGFVGSIKNSASYIAGFKDSFGEIVKKGGSIVDNLLKIAFLYVGFFLIQVIILPLAVFWLLAKFANNLFNTDIPPMLHHAGEPQSKVVPEVGA